MTEGRSRNTNDYGSSTDFSEHCDVHSSSEDYARRFSGAVGQWMLDVQSRAVLQMIEPWLGGTVLDVGGGHAQLAGPLSEAGCAVTILGSDESCGERPASLLAGTNVLFTVGNIIDPPFADAQFDVVTAFRLMAHVHDWRALLRGLCRVARHAVIIDFATPESVNAFALPLFAIKKKVERDTRPFNLQRRRAVESALAQEGFGHFHHIGQYVAPMALHRLLDSPRLSRALETAFHSGGFANTIGSPVVLRATREPPAVRPAAR
ncbi:MAG: class I SAM-dependent methyltransferase [Gammaproteobacteria bacterium]|nr:class I SAM-dependent methyltransferase [Gammaproteobacteria bacterium]